MEVFDYALIAISFLGNDGYSATGKIRYAEEKLGYIQSGPSAIKSVGIITRFTHRLSAYLVLRVIDTHGRGTL